jgi:hypothetical protein
MEIHDEPKKIAAGPRGAAALDAGRAPGRQVEDPLSG